LSFIRFPHLFHPAKRLYLRALTRASVRRARRVITVSEHAAEEAQRLLDLNPGKIDVVYHGVDPRFHPRSAADVAAFREHQGLPERFVLFLGTLEPRKNLVRLIEAFHRLDAPDVALVLAGGRGWYEEEIFASVERLNLTERVIFPGYVPGEDLPLWYDAATVFAYPSLYEGFGMPVTEALASGVPTLTSDRSSLPEAAGDAALLVDPTDVDAIAQGLHRLLTDGTLRETLRQRGLSHAAQFTWQRMAAQTADVYRCALEGETA
jgi:glycosyltransferase involved in cell wall biosynthesis